jgi:hypothetical protein
MHPSGGWLGALFTFVLYGVAPVALVMYLLATPMRRQARRREESAERAPSASMAAGGSAAVAAGSVGEPDDGGHPPGLAVTPERKVP